MTQTFWYVFFAVAAVVSVLNGVYAVTIWFRQPTVPNPREQLEPAVWGWGWRDLIRHPYYLHQAWFNFAGCAMGWAALGYALRRLTDAPERFGWTEAGLLFVGAVGIVGYLPSAIHRIVGAVESALGILGGAAKKLAGGGD